MAQSRKTAKRAAQKTATASSNKKKRAPAATRASRAKATSLAGEDTTVSMVRGLAAIVEDHGLCELIVELPEAKLTLRRAEAVGASQVVPAPMVGPAIHAAMMPPAPVAAPVPVAEPEPPREDAHLVTSPFVGTFYRRPNPDADPYVEVGARVEKGQVLCIVEAMKLMNEIEADTTGIVAAILVEDAGSVEYGQALFKITPA